MSTKLRIGTVAGLALAVAGGTVAATSASSSGDSDSRHSGEVLRLVGKEDSSEFLDFGAADLSQGDQVPFANDLYSGDKKIGEDAGWCVTARVTDAGAATFECLGVNSLPGGDLAVQGSVTYAPGEDVKKDPYRFAITGGTGKYRKAHGTVEVKEVSGVEFRLTFRIIR